MKVTSDSIYGQIFDTLRILRPQNWTYFWRTLKNSDGLEDAFFFVSGSGFHGFPTDPTESSSGVYWDVHGT